MTQIWPRFSCQTDGLTLDSGILYEPPNEYGNNDGLKMSRVILGLAYSFINFNLIVAFSIYFSVYFGGALAVSVPHGKVPCGILFLHIFSNMISTHLPVLNAFYHETLTNNTFKPPHPVR